MSKVVGRFLRRLHIPEIDISTPPENGELLLSYWKRIGGQFDGGFLEAARTAAENHGFFYERGRLHNSIQLEAITL